MDPADLAFVFGALLAPLVLLAVLIQISVVGWRASSRLLLTVAAVEAVLVMSHWGVWWFAFDWVDGEAVPNALFGATTPLMVLSVLVCPALCWVIVFRHRRRRTLATHSRLSIYGPATD